MSASVTCSCPGRWVFVFCYWCEMQDNFEYSLWPGDNESGRARSAHYEWMLFSEHVDQDESPWFVNGDDDYHGLDGELNDRFVGGRNSRQDGRWYERRDGGLVGWRVVGWGGIPRMSYRGTMPKIFYYWDDFCQRCDVPDTEYSDMVHAILHDHRGYAINGSMGFGGGPMDSEETVYGHREPSFRRPSPHFDQSTEWF